MPGNTKKEIAVLVGQIPLSDVDGAAVVGGHGDRRTGDIDVKTAVPGEEDLTAGGQGRADLEEAVAGNRQVQAAFRGCQQALLVEGLVILGLDATHAPFLIGEGNLAIGAGAGADVAAHHCCETGVDPFVSAGGDIGDVAADGVQRMSLGHHTEGAGLK